MQLKREGRASEIADSVRKLEAAGLDVVWVTESYGFDSPTLLGYLAAVTSTIDLGFGIMSVFARTPTLIGQTATGLDEASNGRARLGLGASGPQVVEGWHGVPYVKPLQRTREVVEIVRAVSRRQTIEHRGMIEIPLPAGQGTGLGRPLKLINKPVRDRIPVYIAATSEKSIAAAAEYADGWLSYLFMPEKADEVFGPALAQGAALRPPDLGPLDIVAGGLTAIGEDVEPAMQIARAKTALYVGGMGPRNGNFFNDLAVRLGYAREAAQIQDLYLDGRREEAAAAVPEDLVLRTNLIGSAGFVRDRVQAYIDAGVRTLDVISVGPGDPANAVAQIRDWL